MEVPFLLIITVVSFIVSSPRWGVDAGALGTSPVIAASDVSLHVTRQNTGDLFNPEGEQDCKAETCVGLSSGTASALPGQGDLCHCQCHSHLPTFREDLRICVDDIHECVLAPFVGGSTSQQIPFVFLPLKGQIIHPSKEISFAGIQTPVCAVSGAKFLTETGWVDLRNPVDTDVPFRLFRDEGRTFLQWVGESDLRTRMSGRLVLVYLMCREIQIPPERIATPTGHTIFSPCVAFRVVGSPTRFNNNVSEVAFSPSSESIGTTSSGDRLSVSEYVAIGICSVLLGLIYVASVFLYLHLRKRSRESGTSTDPEPVGTNNVEEGVVKNNPLLSLVVPHGTNKPSDPYNSESTGSDSDMTPDIIQNHHHGDGIRSKKSLFTQVMVHPQYPQGGAPMEQDSSNPSIERLPEENVSIVETLDANRDERLDKALNGTIRRKLYFNPAYFEPQLLMAPPPAALEFLSKIREVITVAKQKMAAKRFAPSLMGIPEEEHSYSLDPLYGERTFDPSISRRSSLISLKRENSRRKTCTGCPGCEPQDFNRLSGKLPEFPACQTCSTTSTSKQNSIRKWLEDVPILNSTGDGVEFRKRLRSPTRSLPEHSGTSRSLMTRAASIDGDFVIRRRKAPPPPPPKTAKKLAEEEIHYDTVPVDMPDMIHEAIIAMDGTTNKTSAPETATPILKKQMNAVISEFNAAAKKLDYYYETDSLERSNNAKGGYSTPTEYADLSSSQPSPSLSTALPMEEEMTMRNAVFNKNTGNQTISKIANNPPDEDHDYELIVLKKNLLPELIQRNGTGTRRNGYSLVSEVYVNNGYNYSSAPSSASESNSSTLDKKVVSVGEPKPCKLLIQVEDCPDNYIPVDESDEFEPDTLDRRPANKSKYQDSLERPPQSQQILLRTSGSFKKDTESHSLPSLDGSNFNRVFGSLREIYEAKTKGLTQPSVLPDTIVMNDEEGRLLTLEERHSKRQRSNDPKTVVPPDVIPPPPHDTNSSSSPKSPIYERPKPPRKILLMELADDGQMFKPPPLPPKNGIDRSTNFKEIHKVGTPVVNQDSGYLSSSSSADSNTVLTTKNIAVAKNSSSSKSSGESESESLDEGGSESGAESVETHSVFFGTFRHLGKLDNNNNKFGNVAAYGSMDSGVGVDNHSNLSLSTKSSNKHTFVVHKHKPIATK